MKTCQDDWSPAPDDTDYIITRMIYFYTVDQPPVIFDHNDTLKFIEDMRETARTAGIRPRIKWMAPSQPMALIDSTETVSIAMTKVANCEQDFEAIIERESNKIYNVGEPVLLNTLLPYVTSHIDEYAAIGGEDQLKNVHLKEAAILFKDWLKKKISDHLILSGKQADIKRFNDIHQVLFRMEQDMLVQDGRLDIAGVSVPRYVLASTPEQYDLLLQKEAGSVDITDWNLFKSELVNKYQEKVDYFDNDLSSEEKVKFYEFKQQFVDFTKWLKQGNGSENINESNSEQKGDNDPKDFIALFNLPTEEAKNCLRDALNILIDLDIIDDDHKYNDVPNSKDGRKRSILDWYFTLNDSGLISRIASSSKSADAIKGVIHGLEIADSYIKPGKVKTSTGPHTDTIQQKIEDLKCKYEKHLTRDKN